MDSLEAQVLKAKKKKDWQKLADWVLSENELEGLINLFLTTQSKRIGQQSAGVFMELVNQDNTIFYPFQQQLVAYLHSENPKITQLRNIYRLFQFAYIREEVEGALLDACFKVLEDPNLPIAVRVFAMTVAFRIGERYPEIYPELKNLIELNLELGNSSGLQNRANKLIQKMEVGLNETENSN